MSNVTVRKFPVTAPDGTEYRVVIKESDLLCGWYAFVSIYVPRKRFGFRKVGRVWAENGDGLYDASNPDYIALATKAINVYCASLERSAERTRKRAESILRKQAALDRFAEWDGRIAEVNE